MQVYMCTVGNNVTDGMSRGQDLLALEHFKRSWCKLA